MSKEEALRREQLQSNARTMSQIMADVLIQWRFGIQQSVKFFFNTEICEAW
jgi:hypothetical protein